jgi:hypothetical protein
MVEYKCEKCTQTFKLKSVYEKHLNRKKHV